MQTFSQPTFGSAAQKRLTQPLIKQRIKSATKPPARSLAKALFGQSLGFSLIETLVALLILSVGIVGATTMQMLSLRGNLSAYYRTQASYIATNMVGRMRSNATGVNDDLYNNMNTATLPVDPVCISVGCSAEQLSQSDLIEWAQYFTNVQGIANYQPLLNGGSASITGDGSNFVIQVNWSERVNADIENQSYLMNFRL
ncbi:MAG: type IV pilus modification protein PilV [Pseudomonadales bacterium]|nr:type IV pilus modification protein PilV [Pseudomonadales bacterium]